MADHDYDEIADPLLIARLAAWFGEGPLPPPDIEEIERAERAAAAERIEDALDLALVARLEAARDGGHCMVSIPDAPPASSFERNLLLVRWPTAGPAVDDEPREYEQPEDIHDSLKEDNTPQAVLRDLFRPVRFFGDISLRAQTIGDPGETGADPGRRAREAMSTSWSLNLPPLPPALIAADIGHLRSELARPWAESEVRPATISAPLADGEDGEEVRDGDAPDHYRWFGIEGGYDPDQ